MSASSASPPLSPGLSMPPRQNGLGSSFTSIAVGSLQAAGAMGELGSVPYVGGAFRGAAVLLQTLEQVRQNRQDFRELCDEIKRIMDILQQEITVHGEGYAWKLKDLCEELERCLQEILTTIEPMRTKPKGIHGHVKKVFQFNKSAGKIYAYRNHIQRLREDFMMRAIIRVGLDLPTDGPAGMNMPQGPEEIRNNSHPQPTVGPAGIPIPDSKDINHQTEQQTQSRLSGGIPVQVQEQTKNATTPLTTLHIRKEFVELSQTAKTFIQLCSFLNCQGISETIFKQASQYLLKFWDKKTPLQNIFKGPAPSKITDSLRKQLQGPAQFLVQLMDMDGLWDSFQFRNMLQDLHRRALIDLDTEKQLFSMDPSLHVWCQSSAKGVKQNMIHIMGMALSTMPEAEIQLTALWLAPHIANSNFNQAEKFTSAILPQKQREFGPDHAETLTAMCTLSVIYRNLGRLQEAKELGLTVLEKQKRVLAYNHSETLSSMDNLVRTFRELGQLQEAQALGIPLLEKQKAILGGGNIQTVRTMSLMGGIHRGLRKYQEAKAVETIALEEYTKILGTDHPDTLLAMKNLAITQKELYEFEETELLEQDLVEKCKKVLGEDHPETLEAMKNLAKSNWHLARFKIAATVLTEVYEKQCQKLGEVHPQTQDTMLLLAEQHCRLGQLKEAETLQTAVYQEHQRCLGSDHPKTLAIMENLSITLLHSRQLEEARALLTLLVEKRTKVDGEDHPATLRTMGTLAVTYYELRKFKLALAIQTVVVEKNEKVWGENHLNARDARTRLDKIKCALS
ncbi:hypothetical protein FB45DRAFT_865881 [Roridomyces roridus]|uniref:TPR-like protein n=1 Tax=Roridomyces roridus TaxID=1738132 RepID=A0AAD7FSU6_9AGAR|nr:hypothetical protein FB45DRAFT_865881 [Roridomyces roridus]